jgi:hypothetical protein
MSNMFFAYDPGDGFSFFGTAKERDEYLETCLSYYRGEAHDEGWPEEEEMNLVCGGIVTHRAQMINREDRPESEEECEEGNWADDCGYRCDYQINPGG